MAEVKWIKITTNMFEDEKIDFIESLPEADAILVIWVKLLAQAGKCNSNGFIFLTENIPYTEEMLAHKFRRSLNVVKLALTTFKNLEMIELDDTGHLKIANWEKHQNVEGLEKIREKNRIRQARYREKQNLLLESNVTDNVTVTPSNVIEVDIDKELDIDIDIDIDIEGEVEEEETITSNTLNKENIETILNAWNKLDLQQLKAINSNTNRHKMLKARLKEYSLEEILKAIESIANSSFLKGQNNRNWVITFDWFIKPNNFLKVLEGNYVDKVSEVNSVKNVQTEEKKFKTKFHLENSRYSKYTAEELEKMVLANSQNRRQSSKDK